MIRALLVPEHMVISGGTSAGVRCRLSIVRTGADSVSSPIPDLDEFEFTVEINPSDTLAAIKAAVVSAARAKATAAGITIPAGQLVAVSVEKG